MANITIVPFNSLPKHWRVEEVDPYEIHVYPIMDWRVHTLTDRCLCDPVVKHGGLGRRVIHNSFDGRETDEHPSWGLVN